MKSRIRIAAVLGIAALGVTGLTISTEHAPAVAAASGYQQPAATFGVGDQHNLSITMTDGVVLKANVYFPTDLSTGLAAPGPFPVVLIQTPYGKDQGDTDSTRGDVGMGKDTYLIERGYINAVVDVRGTGASQGTFEMEQPQESQDGIQLVNWASQLPNSTGTVATLGASYAGINQLLLAGRIGPNSPLKAIFPIVPTDDLYRDIVVAGGVTNPLIGAAFIGGNAGTQETNAITEQVSSLSSAADVTNLLGQLVQHTSIATGLPLSDLVVGGPQQYADGSFWTTRSPQSLLGNIVANKIPAFLMSGWHDGFQRGVPLLYAGLQNAAAGRSTSATMLANQVASPDYQLVMGPWYHATLGEPGAAVTVQPNHLAIRWFDHFLKGIENGVTDTTTPFRSYDLASKTWTQSATYPYANATPTKLYFAGSGALSATRPTATGSDSIVWSNVPVCSPYIDQFGLLGNLENIADEAGQPSPPCNADDRGTQLAPGATTYTTAPLAGAQTIAGPMSAHIVARVSSADSEWIVRVEDVAPDGSSVPLARGVLLGSQRAVDGSKSWKAADGSYLIPFHPFTRDATQANVPGSLQTYDVEVFPVVNTIAAGHSIRVTIGTSDSPAVIPNVAQTVGLIGGVYGIQRGGQSASYVQIPLAAPGAIGAACTDPDACP